MHDGEAEGVAKTREQVSNEGLLEKVFAARESYDTDRTDPAKVKAYTRALDTLRAFILDGKQPDGE